MKRISTGKSFCGISGKKLKIRVAFEQRDGGVFHLDDVFKRIIVRVGANARRLTANPLHQIKRMYCLIDKHSASFGFFLTPPFSRRIIRLVAMPQHVAESEIDFLS